MNRKERRKHNEEVIFRKKCKELKVLVKFFKSKNAIGINWSEGLEELSIQLYNPSIFNGKFEKQERSDIYHNYKNTLDIEGVECFYLSEK